jgi:hypothetical protein
MKNQRKLSTWLGVIVGTLCALLLAAQGQASDRGRAFTEEFHQTYALSPGGQINLENINGAVHITAWDRNEVKVDAVKYADRQERLAEAQIRVDAGKDRISIRTEYRDHDHTFNHPGWNNPASVEYTLMVPRSARLDEIKLINGALDIHGVSGEVLASCINGKLAASGLQGRVRLSTINSPLVAQFDRLGSSPLDLSSVNGSLELTLPSDAKAEIDASTVHGGIDNDFGLMVRNHQWVGHSMSGELGGGGTEIKLSNVNGAIAVRHAGDGRALSTHRDSNRNGDGDEI